MIPIETQVAAATPPVRRLTGPLPVPPEPLGPDRPDPEGPVPVEEPPLPIPVPPDRERPPVRLGIRRRGGHRTKVRGPQSKNLVRDSD
jgi:hypothetical protein